ncbi:MAG TPA: DUF1684 domain-containing protein [Ohtaekwangia sp.]
MKKQNIILLILVVVALISVFYSFLGQDQSGYLKQIEEERAEKERFMKTSKESPFAENPTDFKGLTYYPPDLKYKITADLTPITNKQVVLLPTSDGKEERYVEYAFAEFDLDGYHNKLLILEMVDMGPYRGKLFLAFGDETSAVETYGAGRYLDITKVQGSNTITLDFNQAYNPYCAYNESYSCPIPPRENLLKVAIRAGEKNYHSE